MEEIKKSKQNKIINILLSFVIFILLILFGLKINFTKVVVNGSSMHPTLIGNYEDGYEYGYTDRFIFKITGLDRYDIVVIKKSSNELWIKRLIGMPNEKIQIKDLERIVFLTSNQIINIFKEYYGITPHKYLTELRLNEACELLLSTRRSLSTIAENVGYNDYSIFYKAFYARYNMSPLEYRKLSKKNRSAILGKEPPK